MRAPSSVLLHSNLCLLASLGNPTSCHLALHDHYTQLFIVGLQDESVLEIPSTLSIAADSSQECFTITLPFNIVNGSSGMIMIMIFPNEQLYDTTQPFTIINVLEGEVVLLSVPSVVNVSEGLAAVICFQLEFHSIDTQDFQVALMLDVIDIETCKYNVMCCYVV